jgi:hypothetical protein
MNIKNEKRLKRRKINKRLSQKVIGRKTSLGEKFCYLIADFLSRKNLISDYRKTKLTKFLKVSGIDKTPELFFAEIGFTTVLIALIAMPLAIFIPFLSPLPIIASVAYYMSATRKPEKEFEKCKRLIEKELPCFTDFITSSLRDSRDVFSIIKAYLIGSTGAFREELERTVADINSSGIEKGLVSFERRVGSQTLSNVVRALLGIVRGDTDIAYFEILSYDIKQREIANLKMEAQRRPGRMRKYCLFLLFCFITMYFTVFIIYILDITRGVF